MKTKYQGEGFNDLSMAVLERLAESNGGAIGGTTRIAGTDAAQALPDSLIKDADSNYAGYVRITCETQDIRYSIGTTTPTQGASAVGHVLAAGATLDLKGAEEVTGFRFLNKTSGSVGVIQATAKF